MKPTLRSCSQLRANGMFWRLLLLLLLRDKANGWFGTSSKDATSNKCIASSNKCLTSSNKKLLGAHGLTTRSILATSSKGIA